MAKDYHKGKKIACYIPDELCKQVDAYVKNCNIYYNHMELDDLVSKAAFKLSRTDVIKMALKEYLHNHDINSKNAAYIE